MFFLVLALQIFFRISKMTWIKFSHYLFPYFVAGTRTTTLLLRCVRVCRWTRLLLLTMLCCFNKRVRLLFGCRILLWLPFMLSGLLVLMERARLSQSSTRARGTELQPLGQTRCMIFPPITSILLFNNLTTLCLLPVLLFQSITTVLRIFG